MRLLQRKELGSISAGRMGLRLVQALEGLIINIAYDLVQGWRDKHRRRLEKKQLAHLKDKRAIELEIGLIEEQITAEDNP